MAYEQHKSSDFTELAQQASEVARIMKRAEKTAEKAAGKTFRCELGTIQLRLAEVLKRSLKIELDLELADRGMSGAREAGTDAHAATKPRKKGA